MERKDNGLMMTLNSVKLERKNFDVSDERIIKIEDVYACHFGKANMNGEIVTRDSFDKFFKQMKNTDGIMPSMNWMHSWDAIVGTWTDLVPNSVGLKVNGYIAKETWAAKNYIIPLIEANVPLYLSTEGFVPWESIEWNDAEGTYIAKDFNLIRISIVDIPADFEQKNVVKNAIELHRNRMKEKEDEEKTESKANNNILII